MREPQIITTIYRSEPLRLPDGVLRASALVASGLSRQRIKNLTDAGKLQHIGRGLYSLPEATVTENHDLAQVAARVPQGVICLSSALQFHGLTTVSPWRIDLMLPRGARPPRIGHPPVAVTYAGDLAYQAGIEEHEIEGVTVKVTSVAKTLADCFKYRSKVGLDVALEALKQALAEKRASHAEIRRYARICRVENVVRPYMEAFAL